jgi:hypothetical protein
MRSPKSRSRSNKNRNRSVGNIINRVFDSSGPEGKVRGTPQQIIDKYNQLARDSQLSNNRVATENFQQHSEHYVRLLADAQREMDARREQQDRENKERHADRERERQSRPPNDNGASEALQNTVINEGNNSTEGVTGRRDSEHTNEIDDLNQPIKKNKSGKSRNGRSRTSDQSSTVDSPIDLSSEDVPSVEAAE